MKKQCFLTSNGIEEEIKEEVKEAFICSSLWFKRRNIQPIRYSCKSLLTVLLLACGDIESCPGPTNCFGCDDPFEKDVDHVTCRSCNNIYHLKCFKGLSNETSCHRCSEVDANIDLIHNVEMPELKRLMETPGLKVCHLNIRGLVNNIHKLSAILSEYKVDIFGLTETHLTDNIYSSEVEIPGYDFVKRDRLNGPGGGVAVYISKETRFIHRTDLEDEVIESIWIEILQPHSKGFLINVIYRPPDTSKYLSKSFNDNFNDSLFNISKESKETIIIGDINCNFLVKNNHKEVKAILNLNGYKTID